MDIPGKIAGHIGTPLTGNATKVLLLGAGELGKQLAISFQSLGLEVHAVDKYQGAPAHQVAHLAISRILLTPRRYQNWCSRFSRTTWCRRWKPSR